VSTRTLHVIRTHRDLDHHVLALCREKHLHAHHDWESLGADRGFPDWVIFGPGGLLWRENKTAGGKPSPEQTAVGYMLQALGLDWDIWRPADALSRRIERELDAIASPRRNPTPGS
jgi:hypothetical protein